MLFDGIMHMLLVYSSEFDLLSTATNFSFAPYFFFPPNIINWNFQVLTFNKFDWNQFRTIDKSRLNIVLP